MLPCMQCFFSNLIEMSPEHFDPIHNVFILKMNNVWGELAGMSAKIETLHV